jgi:subtilase family serine protease
MLKSILLLLVVAGLSSPRVLAQAAIQGLPTAAPHKNVPKAVADGSAKLTGHLDSNQMLRVVIGLQPPHLAEEEEFLKELHTKSSPQFHKFLTADEWNARFAPTPQDEQAVVYWAESQGLKVTNRYANRLVVDLEGPASTIEKAFGVTINTYQLGANSHFSNDRDPVIPSALSNIIHSVQGLNNIQMLHAVGGMQGPPVPGPIYVPGPVFATSLSAQSNGDRKKLPSKTLGNAAQGGPIPGITNGAYDPTDLFNSNAYDAQALYNQHHCCNPFGNPGSSPPEASIAIAGAYAVNFSDIAGFAAIQGDVSCLQIG